MANLGTLAAWSGAAQGAEANQNQNIAYSRDLIKQTIDIMNARPGTPFQAAYAAASGNIKALKSLPPIVDPYGQGTPPADGSANPSGQAPAAPIVLPPSVTPPQQTTGGPQLGLPHTGTLPPPPAYPGVNGYVKAAMGTPQTNFSTNPAPASAPIQTVLPMNHGQLPVVPNPSSPPMVQSGRFMIPQLPTPPAITTPAPSGAALLAPSSAPQEPQQPSFTVPSLPTPPAQSAGTVGNLPGLPQPATTPSATPSGVVGPIPIAGGNPSAPSNAKNGQLAQNLYNTAFPATAMQDIWAGRNDTKIKTTDDTNATKASTAVGKLVAEYSKNFPGATMEEILARIPPQALQQAQAQDMASGSTGTTQDNLGESTTQTGDEIKKERADTQKEHDDALNNGLISKGEDELFKTIGNMNPVQQQARINAFNAANPGANIPFDINNPYKPNADVQALITLRSAQASLDGSKNKFYEPWIKSVMGKNASQSDLAEAQALAVPQDVQIKAQNAATSAYDADTKRQLGTANYQRLAADAGYQSTIKAEGLLQSQIDGLTSQNQRAADSMNMSDPSKQAFIEANNKQIADLQTRLNDADQTRAQYLQQASSATGPQYLNQSPGSATTAAPVVQQAPKGNATPVVTHDPSTAQYTLAHGGALHTRQGIVTQPGGPDTPLLLNGKPWAPAK